MATISPSTPSQLPNPTAAALENRDPLALFPGQPHGQNNTRNMLEVQRIVDALRSECISTIDQLYCLIQKAALYDPLAFFFEMFWDNLPSLIFIAAQEEICRWFIASNKEASGIHGARRLLCYALLRSLVLGIASSALKEVTAETHERFSLPPPPKYGGPEAEPAAEQLYDSILTAPLESTLPLNTFFYICMALRRPKKTPLKVKFALSFATLLNQIFRSWKALVESQTYHQLPIPENHNQSSKWYHQRWLRGSPESIRIKAHFLNHSTPFSFCIDLHRRWAQKILSNFFEILVTALILLRTWATFIVLIPSAFLASRADDESDAEREIVWRMAFLFAYTDTKNQTLTRMAIIALGVWYIRIANSSDNR
ncbi:hypothetical protein BDV98DRAFT_598595 [Pterulicium gracile]|uniref:Uncharacterized protein n=1 Tax=Pterulicium gracile TaxID=1884261 RepID=A0A5C3Q1G0_9AGAR|nr:hypothetical protein BDV98DRAFT_598595 [Pterula gracilis]